MAKNVEGITIEFQGNTLKFDNSVDGMKKAINTLKKEVALCDQTIKKSEDSAKVFDAMKLKIKNLEQQERIANNLLEEWNSRLADLNTEGISTTSDKWKNTQIQIAEATKNVIQIDNKLIKAKEDLKKFTDSQSDIAKLNRKLNETGDYLHDIGNNIKTLGDALKPVSDLASKTLAYGVDNAKDFESAFAGVIRVLDNADAETIEEIRNGIKEISTQTPTSAVEVAELVQLMAQLGIGNENLLEFSKVMIDVGNVTNMEASKIGEAFAKLYNITGEDLSSINKFASAFLDLANKGASTEDEIANMAYNISASAHMVGMSQAEILALSTALADVGLEAKGGGSAISQIITKIDKAVSTNSSTLKTWSETAGLSVEEFKKLWSESSISGLEAVLVGMTDMSRGGENLNVLLEELGVKEIRQSDALKRLAGRENSISKYVDISNNAWEENVALTENVAIQNDTTAVRIELLKNSIENLVASLGDLLLPIINVLVEVVQKVINWLDKLSPQAKNIILISLAIVSAISKILIGAGKLITWVGSLYKALAPFSSMLTGIVNVGTTLFSIINPFILVIGALIGIVALLYKNCEPFRDFVDNMIKKMEELWDKFKQTNWIEKLGEKFGWLGEVIGIVLESVKTLIGFIDTALGKIKELKGNDMYDQYSRSFGLFNSGGYGDMSLSGASGLQFASGGLTLNNSFTINSNNITREQVKSWSSWIVDDVNEELGRRIS